MNREKWSKELGSRLERKMVEHFSNKLNCDQFLQKY